MTDKPGSEWVHVQRMNFDAMKAKVGRQRKALREMNRGLLAARRVQEIQAARNVELWNQLRVAQQRLSDLPAFIPYTHETCPFWPCRLLRWLRQ